MYAYFIDISQGSVKTHLWCGKIYNNHIIANWLQCASERILIGKDMDKNKMARFLAHPVC